MRAPEKGPAAYPVLNTVDSGPIPFTNHYTFRLDTCIKTLSSSAFVTRHCVDTFQAGLLKARPVQLPDSYDPGSNTHLYYMPVSIGSVSLLLLSSIRLDLQAMARSPYYPYENYSTVPPESGPKPVATAIGDTVIAMYPSEQWSFGPKMVSKGHPVDYPGIPVIPRVHDFQSVPINPYIAILRDGKLLYGLPPGVVPEAEPPQPERDPLTYAPIANSFPDGSDQLARDSANIRIGRVRVNQAGYRPSDNKWLYYVVQSAQFTVISHGKAVGMGVFSPTGQSSSSSLKIRASNNGKTVMNGDTRYRLAGPTVSGPVQEGKLPGLPEGTYRVVVGADTSQPFIIHPGVYSMVKDALLKFFGIQRSGNSDSWFHPPSHLKDGVQGGWYDCGDFLKEGITQSYAMMVLGLASAAFSDRDTDHYGKNQNHTRVTDGIPDLLYETKHGADYVLASYDLAGGKISEMITSVGDFKDHMYWGPPEFQELDLYLSLL